MPGIGAICWKPPKFEKIVRKLRLYGSNLGIMRQIVVKIAKLEKNAIFEKQVKRISFKNHPFGLKITPELQNHI